MAKNYHNLLNDNLTAANIILERERMPRRIERLARLYNIKPKVDAPGEDPEAIIRVNLVYPNVRTALSSIAAKNPEYLVRPRNELSVDFARNAELMLNYVTSYMKYSREFRHCLTNARLFHYGVVKLGMEKKNGMELPGIESWHPLSVRFDPHLEHFYPEDGRWVAFKFKKTIAALRENSFYKEKDLDTLAAKYMEKDGETFSEEKTEIILWEHYLKEGNKILVFTGEFEGSESTWIREGEFTNVIGLPSRVLTFSPAFDGWFPLSPVEQWIDIQMEFNALFSQLLVHASRAARKYGYDMTKVPEEERRGFESTEDGVFIGVRGSVREAIQAIEHAPLSTDIYALNQRLEQLVQQISGIGSLQMGAIPQTGSRSATEASIVQNNLSLRASDNQEVWEEFVAEVGQAVLNLAQAHMKGDLWMKITNAQWVQMTREQIVGDMDVRVSAGSTMPTDRQQEWGKAQELFTMFNNDPLINQIKLRNYTLSKQGDIRDITEWIQTPPPMPGLPGMPGMEGAGMPPGMPPMPELPSPEFGSPQLENAQIAQEGMGQSPLENAAAWRGAI